LHIPEARSVGNEPVGDVVTHLVEGDQRFMIAGPARQRIRAVEHEHLHLRAGPIGWSGHLSVVGAAEEVPLGQNRVAVDSTQAEVVLLRVAGGFVEASLVPAVVQPIHVEEHADDAGLQIVGIGR